MRYLVLSVFFIVLSLIISGFVLKASDDAIADKLIGAGTLGLFLVLMPLFLIYRSKGKRFSDYLLTPEKLQEMKRKRQD